MGKSVKELKAQWEQLYRDIKRVDECEEIVVLLNDIVSEADTLASEVQNLLYEQAAEEAEDEDEDEDQEAKIKS